jgi:hypothetical protein
MVAQPISGLTQVGYKNTLVIPAIDPTAPTGLKNVGIPITALPGGTGSASTAILNGSVQPSNQLGNDGDFYLFSQDGVVTLLGPKYGGAWPESGTVLNGPPGAVGTAWFVGMGAPVVVQGAVAGSNYLDKTTSNVWTFDGTTWSLQANLAGQRGSNWTVGNGAPTSTTGVLNGDIYLDQSTGNIWQYESEWTEVSTIVPATIAAEATTRAAADTANADAITSEAATRAATDTANANSITTEATARATGDATNSTAIANEATARVSGDATNAAAAAAALTVANAAIPQTAAGTTIATLSGGTVPLSQMSPAILGANHYLGTWNASTNTPALASGTAPAVTSPTGGYYIVNVAGTTAIDGISVWNDGDWIIWNGTTWQKLNGQANPVSSVAGLQGAISESALATALALTAPATAPFGTGAGDVADGAVLAAETTARTSADATLTTNLGTEATARASGDAANATATALVQTNLNTEANTRGAADTANATATALVQTNLNAEAAARVAADTTLAGNLSAEATSRTSGDTANATATALVQANLNTEASTRASSDTANSTAIANEATARATAITTEATARAAGDTANATAAASALAVANAAIPSSALGQPLGPVQADSSNKVPLANLPASVVGSSHYLGTWNASTDTPSLTSGVAPSTPAPVGGYYIVSVAGTTTLDGISAWSVGDWLLWSGAAWEKLDGQANPVSSVAGLQGAVTTAQLASALNGGTALSSAGGTLNVVLGTGGAAAYNDSRITGAIQAANYNQPNGPFQLDASANATGATILAPGTTAVVNLGEIALQTPPLILFGVAMDGVTDDLAALNRLTTYINSLGNTQGTYDINLRGNTCALSGTWVPPSHSRPSNGGFCPIAGLTFSTVTPLLSTPAGAHFTATISNGSGAAGTQMVVSAMIGGAIQIGVAVPGAAAGTIVVSQASGTAGGIGTYIVSVSQLVSAATNFTQTGVFGVTLDNINIDCGKLANCVGWNNASTSNIFANNSVIQHWGVGGGGYYSAGGKIQTINCNFQQWVTADSQYSTQSLRSGIAVQLVGCADSTFIGGNMDSSGSQLDVDENTQHVRFLGVHFYAGGGGTVFSNPILGSLRGYALIFDSCYFDAGVWVIPISSSTHTQSPPSPSIQFTNCVLLYNGSNASFTSWFQFTTSKANSALGALIIDNIWTGYTNTVPLLSFATTGSGSWAASVPTAYLSTIVSGLSIKGGTVSVAQSTNLGGYYSIIGAIKNGRTVGQGGAISIPTDSSGYIAANQVNTPIILSANAVYGTEFDVTTLAVGGVTVSTAVTTVTPNSANVGNGTVGSISWGGSAPPGAYLLTFLTSTTMSVTDPNLVNLGTATVGTAFTSAETNFTYTAGSTAPAVGDVNTIIYNPGTASIGGAVGASAVVTQNGSAKCKCIGNAGGAAVWLVTGSIAGSGTSATLASRAVTTTTDAILQSDNGATVAYENGASAVAVSVQNMLLPMGCDMSVEGTGVVTWTASGGAYLNGTVNGAYASQGAGLYRLSVQRNPGSAPRVVIGLVVSQSLASVSAGAGTAGALIVANSSGLADTSFIPLIVPFKGGTGASPLMLPKYRNSVAKTRAGLGDTNALFLGDSTTYGRGTSSPPAGNLTDCVTKYLAAQWQGYPAVNGNGIMGDGADVEVRTTIPDPRITPGVWVANSATTLGGFLFKGTVGSPLVYAPGGATPFNTFKVFYTLSSGAGTFTATGGTAVNMVAAGNTAPQTAIVTAAATNTTNTLTCNLASGGPVNIIGIIPYNSAVSNVNIINAGWPASVAANWALNTNTYSSLNVLGYLAPNLTIITAGVNDWGASTPTPVATFIASLQTVITEAMLSGDVILVSGTPSENTAQSLQNTYVVAMQQLAALNNIPFIDINGRWQSYAFTSALTPTPYFDGLHPNNVGYADQAIPIGKMLANI